MRLTQGTFSFLPDLSDEQIEAQVRYMLANGWAVNIEHTDDPHPRNTYWEMWGQPMFDLDVTGAVPVMAALAECRRAHPGLYIRLSAFDSSKGFESLALSFIVQRPTDEPGFDLARSSGPGRQVAYTIHPYSAQRPSGRRYGVT